MLRARVEWGLGPQGPSSPTPGSLAHRSTKDSGRGGGVRTGGVGWEPGGPCAFIRIHTDTQTHFCSHRVKEKISRRTGHLLYTGPVLVLGGQ